MWKYVYTLILLVCIQQTYAQQFETGKYTPADAYDNVHVEKIYSDSAATSFIIHIKKEVVLHKHAEHTEQVYILEGTGKMRLGDEWILIKPGDYIVIPKNTPHAVIVTSETPLKVLSIQTPMFDGTDRILITE